MGESIEQLGYYAVLLIGIVFVIQRLSLLVLDLLKKGDSSIDQEDYILYKKYRSSNNAAIRFTGKVLDASDFFILNIFKKLPLVIVLIAGLVVIYVAYAAINNT